MINQRMYLIFYAVVLIFVPLISEAQKSKGKHRDPNIDLEAWGGIGYNCKFNKSWELSLMTQARMQSMVREFDRFLIELETQYNLRFHKLVKPIKIGVGVRYIGAADDHELENYFRVHADFMYKFEWKRLQIGYRLRGQFRNEIKEKEGLYKDYWTKDLRNMIKIGYNFKKWKLDPEIWFELFFHDELGALNGLTKCRIGIKTSYRITDNHSLGIKYFLEMGTHYYDPKYTNVIALSYQYRSKLKKRKKKKKISGEVYGGY